MKWQLYKAFKSFSIGDALENSEGDYNYIKDRYYIVVIKDGFQGKKIIYYFLSIFHAYKLQA